MRNYSCKKIELTSDPRGSIIPAAVMLVISVIFVLFIGKAVVIPGIEPPELSAYISVFNSRFTIDGTNDLLLPEKSASGDEFGENASAADVIVGFPSVSNLSGEGYYRSVGVFASGWNLGFGDVSVYSPGNVKSFGKETAEIVSRQTGAILGFSEKDIPALEAKMGFVLRRNEDGSTALYDSTGYKIYEAIPDDLKFTGERDSADNAVFEQGGSYLFWNRASRAFEASPYNPLTDRRGVNGCAPDYYGKGDSALTLAQGESGKWGYKNGDNFIISPIFTSAYPFRDNLGAACGDDGRLHILDTGGGELFTGMNLYIADTNGPESFGYYFFDRGIMLAKELISSSDGITSEKTIALSSNGGLFPVPKDYSVLGYSDGVLLLEKNGKYGYMDSDGRWVSDPLYSYAEPFYEGLAVVAGDDGKMGVIDRDGNTIIPLAFDLITSVQEGIMTLYDESCGWQVAYKFAK